MVHGCWSGPKEPRVPYTPIITLRPDYRLPPLLLMFWCGTQNELVAQLAEVHHTPARVEIPLSQQGGWLKCHKDKEQNLPAVCRN